LLPANVALLKELGVNDQVAAIAMPKYGVEFVSPWHNKSMTLEFTECWDKTMPMAYQVPRAQFDEILLRNAQQKGVDVREQHRVTAVEFLPDHAGALVTVQDAHGQSQQWNARFVLDASGRDTFLANKLKGKLKNPKHNSSALFAHVEGAVRLPGKQEGNISIFWFEHGWFWFIPLPDGVTSVGAVCWPYYLKSRKTDLTQFFHDTVALCPPLAERLKAAKLATEVQATGNYSYNAQRSHGANYLLLGDAFAFVDPVFSSGVFLAMNSGVVGAQTAVQCLRDPASAPAALKRFDQVMRKGPREFSWFIYRVTNPTMRDLFMEPRNMFRVKEALLSVFAGDIFGKTPIWPSLYVFKGIYYLSSLFNLRRTITAWKRRQINIQDVDAPPRSA
jgi:flavin-dependent dehydrogenase